MIFNALIKLSNDSTFKEVRKRIVQRLQLPKFMLHDFKDTDANYV